MPLRVDTPVAMPYNARGDRVAPTAMRFDIFTLFPQMFTGPFTESILKRAVEAGLLDIRVHDIRSFTSDRHHVCDDYPYGGGAGMLIKPEPVFAAVETVLEEPAGSGKPEEFPVILLSPQGRLFSQSQAQRLSRLPRIALICGHYEGVDERVRQHLVTEEISVGDYVLTGGELPAMILVDAVSRLVPGVLDAASTCQESHSEGLLEYPQYTRPPAFRGWRVPDVLLSGNHAQIAAWRRRASLLLTKDRRPDLLASAKLSDGDRETLRRAGDEMVED